MRSGFIVNAVTESAARGQPPTVALYCRDADGQAFVVRDRRFVPYFYVDARRAAEAAALAGVTVGPSDRKSLGGAALARVSFTDPTEQRPLRQALTAQGVPCFEADLRPVSRYLIDHDLKGALQVDAAPAQQTPDGPPVFVDPTLCPARHVPRLSVLSLDIETTANADCVLSIALVSEGARDEVLLLAPQGSAHAPAVTLPDAATRVFTSERALLVAFVAAVRARDPDVITGWNVIDFDLAVLLRRARSNGLRLGLGKDGSAPYLTPARSFWSAGAARVTGRVVLDGIALVRGAFIPMEELGLDFVATKVLGVGKTVHGPDKLDELQRLYRDDPAAFVAYNLNDARLVLRILEALRLIDLAIARSLLTGMPLDRVSGSVSSFDALYLPRLGRRGFAAPSVDEHATTDGQALGGLVLEPRPGLYRNVLVVDFKSLYPSLIRTFQIDPLGHALARDEHDCIEAPNGSRFSRTPGLLPEILDGLFPRRDEAKRRGDATASHAIKILMNSLYGVLGSPACRFHDPALANAITGFGREILAWTKARIEALGMQVLYGDTDSLFIALGEDDAAQAMAMAQPLVDRLNADLAEHIAARWRTESKLELEVDTLYLRLLLPKMRQRDGGARKRYAGLVEERGERRVSFTGMEVVRRDWTELAKTVQRELHERLFSDRPVDTYLRDIKRALDAGELDALLVYKKALRKPLASYTASTPPHVAAARKSAGDDRLVSYVMTTAGPEPTDARRHPIDRRHYVEKQLRPVAEPILELLGLDFDTVTGAPVQLRLL